MIWVGTAGYHYADWKGVFYPEDLPEKEWLPFYARQFAFTELNTTFYRNPHPAMLLSMAAKTPPGFRFFIKAYRTLTHDRAAAAADVGAFAGAAHALAAADRLAGILLQFPTSFRKRPENVAHLRWLRGALDDFPLVVEFRHREWTEDPDTFALLRAEGLAYACVDEPQFRTLVPPLVTVTAPPAYVRFHGRNYRQWWAHRDPAQRYDYLYSEEELREWVPRITRLHSEAGTVFTSMNNHRRGQAAINGRMLRDLLSAAGLPVAGTGSAPAGQNDDPAAAPAGTEGKKDGS